MPFGLEVDGEDLGVGTYSVIDTAVINKNESIVIPKFLHPDVKEFRPVFIPQGIRNTMMKEVRPTFIENENYIGLTYGNNAARDLDFDYQTLIERDEEYVIKDPLLSNISDLDYFQDLSNKDDIRSIAINTVPNIVENDTGVLTAEYPTFEYYHAHGINSVPSGKKYLVPLYVSDTEPTSTQTAGATGYVSGKVNWYNPSTNEVKYKNSSGNWVNVVVNFNGVSGQDADAGQLLCLQVENDFIYDSLPLCVLSIDRNIRDFRSSLTFLEEVKNTTGKCLIFFGAEVSENSLPTLAGFASLYLHMPYYVDQYGGRGTITYNASVYTSPGVCSVIHPYIATEIASVTEIVNSLTTLQFNFNVHINGPTSSRSYIPEEGETSPAYWVVNYRKRLDIILSADFSSGFSKIALINAQKYLTSSIAFHIDSLASFLVDIAAINYGTDSPDYQFARKYLISILRSISYVDDDISYDVYSDWLFDYSVIDTTDPYEERNFNLIYYYLLQKESYKADGYVESDYAQNEYFVDGLQQMQTFEEFFEAEQEDLRWINDYSAYGENGGDYFCVILGR